MSMPTGRAYFSSDYSGRDIIIYLVAFSILLVGFVLLNAPAALSSFHWFDTQGATLKIILPFGLILVGMGYGALAVRIYRMIFERLLSLIFRDSVRFDYYYIKKTPSLEIIFMDVTPKLHELTSQNHDEITDLYEDHMFNRTSQSMAMIYAFSKYLPETLSIMRRTWAQLAFHRILFINIIVLLAYSATNPGVSTLFLIFLLIVQSVNIKQFVRYAAQVESQVIMAGFIARHDELLASDVRDS